MAEKAVNTEENADYARGLFVCEKPGHEFAAVGTAGMTMSLIGTQVFAMMFLVPVVGFYILRNLLGVSPVIAGVLAGVLSIVIVVFGLVFLRKVSGGQSGVQKGAGVFLTNESDSRFRVRVVIPKKRQSSHVMKWATLAMDGEMVEQEQVSEDDLGMLEGGFEPIIVRPRFGIKRDKHYWWTAVICGISVVGLTVYGLTFVFGSFQDLMQGMGLLGYALTGLGMAGGAYCAELLWPIYVRLVPGQLDVFRYGFLGSGEARVESFDLRKVGVCVDFGGYTISLEPERPIGEPLPKLVQSKRWPHGQCFPEEYQPTYFSVAMVRGRREFAQRLVQGSRTDEPTPCVSMTSLGEE